MTVFYLIPLFFLTALVYSTAGFGGGSTYLALLLLFGFPYGSVPKIALVCNLVVVIGALYHHVRGGHLPFKRVLPFVLTSIPFAYVGGRLPVGKGLFLALAGISLAAAGLRLLFAGKRIETTASRSPLVVWSTGTGAGAILGFVAGLTGIGGGIFLAPLLYFLRWGNPREIAAMASFFILTNSLSGLAGQLQKGNFAYDLGLMLPLGVAVLLGGQLGSRLSLGHLTGRVLRRVTAMLILWVAGTIFWRFL
jgi:uncharacterized membrane protein YfcA